MHQTSVSFRRASYKAVAVCMAVGSLCLPFAVTATPYTQTNLIATDASYGAAIVDPTITNAWGIAIRPAGLGGHFWIAANGTSTSSQWVGDVNGVPLQQDALAVVTVPGPAGAQGTPTGVAFNGGSGFLITQGDITNAPAKFIFGTDNGVISAWTERKNPDGSFNWPSQALAVIDRSADGVQFFGVGVDGLGGRLYAANFGTNPGMLVYDAQFNDITASAGFANPFGQSYQPFNVQVLGTSVFVTYALWDSEGEESAGVGQGRVAEFLTDGRLVRTWGSSANPGHGLNAPWGLAMAPSNFGALSNHLLVGNFGDGTVSAFDPNSHDFVDVVRGLNGEAISIEGLWGLQFGNGASLGEADRLYFAAGPQDETAGLFGYLAVSSVPEPGSMVLMALAGLGLVVSRRRTLRGARP
jgi:uncharacterized protein (TIGR03118 family)